MLDKNLLKQSYGERFEESLRIPELSLDNVKPSRDYFEINSLVSKQFIPKKLHTYCVVAGVPFDSDTIEFINKCCSKIRHVLDDSDVYFVKPQNLGLELLVIKWPNDNLQVDTLKQMKTFLAGLSNIDIQIKIEGFQFHSDGCIVLRGYDSQGDFQKIRQQAITKIPNLPKKQSSWCHIPIGRILSPVHHLEYCKLKDLAQISFDSWHHSFIIQNLKLLDERRWYQEDKILLFQRNFN
ncbi:hypothetical protein [Synechococcus sp. CBW1107]|uniref:hypothetical protein n=1 Tax=Synechococcus sp. CBW1107 TaxID=2789857 RepID=UPI002AD2AA88|nr:hypothetical protein [Synechococcus sp. CBW1107]